ncbi:hypothetical protein MBH78_18745 [Oceanimonas sp. NS1]|nr:hypothetical protein [Oceanimonas sp. NS1]
MAASPDGGTITAIHTTETQAMELLLVEDDAKIAAFLTRGLTEQGYRVQHCSRAEEAAWQAWNRLPPLPLSISCCQARMALSWCRNGEARGPTFPFCC